MLKLDCPGFIPGRSYKSRGELSSSKQDRSQKAPTSRTTSSVGAEKQLYSAWGPWATITEAHTESSSSAGHLTLPDILTSSVLVSGLTYGIFHLTMPATHSRRCALPGRDLSSSTTTRAGLRSARRAPSDRERIRISNVLAAQGRAPPAANGGLGTTTRTSSGRLGTKRAAGTSPPATVTKAPRTKQKPAKTARSTHVGWSELS